MMVRASTLHNSFRFLKYSSLFWRWSNGQCRTLHTNLRLYVAVSPLIGTAPPPSPTVRSPEHSSFIEPQKLELTRQLNRESCTKTFYGKRNGTDEPCGPRKRFWKEVHISDVKDKRPLRRPNSKILTIPSTKPHLATAIAIEWELLTSTQQAQKPHMIPLTSLTSRALDIIDSDNSPTNQGTLRNEIVDSVLRYLNTDSLLCWVPMPTADLPGYETHVSRVEPLRLLQQRTAKPILAFLESHVWPGINIEPALDDNNIIPKAQSPETHQLIRRWVHQLSAWNLCALERAVLAGKGLLTAVRFLVEWSEDFHHLHEGAPRNFGIEEAAIAASLEVEWQVGMWGVVEDTHDVDREDLRRQFGTVVILVSGYRE